jgi:UDP-N-acetylglucosamine 2-epimerase (non-hydrolysing)
MIKVLSLVGTRPEAVKMAPVIEELKRHPRRIVSKVCVTAQHRDMLDRVLELFEIIPDYDLDVMRADQTCGQVVASIMQRLEPILEQERPDWLLVQGDTTTVMTAALASFYGGAKIGHVEAGLRTFNKHHPFPEEISRRIVTLIADLHLAPTDVAARNLAREGVAEKAIVVTGNPVIDALELIAGLPYEWAGGALAPIPRDRRLVVVTAHRRESFGAPLESICLALRDIAERFDDVHLVYPVHPNPHVQETVHSILSRIANLTLTPALDYLSFVHLIKHSHLVLTDSGGIQEEAPALGKPVLVLRDETERPEGVIAGVARVVGTDRERIGAEATRLLTDEARYRGMVQAANPYGDGHAARRIVGALLRASGMRSARPVVPFTVAGLERELLDAAASNGNGNGAAHANGNGQVHLNGNSGTPRQDLESVPKGARGSDGISEQ